MNATTMVLLLMGGVSACLGSAQIDWEKFYKGDSDEVMKVSSIRALAATNCIRTIESAQQFVQVVPDYVAHVQGFWRTNGPQRLTIRGQKHYRYEISMALDVWFDSTLTNAIRVADPIFNLTEYATVSLREGGGAHIKSNPESQRDFSLKEWKKIWEAGGNFGLLNLKIKTNAPVPNFREYWERSSGRRSKTW